jgi:hypothetical protein
MTQTQELQGSYKLSKLQEISSPKGHLNVHPNVHHCFVKEAEKLQFRLHGVLNTAHIGWWRFQKE